MTSVFFTKRPHHHFYTMQFGGGRFCPTSGSSWGQDGPSSSAQLTECGAIHQALKEAVKLFLAFHRFLLVGLANGQPICGAEIRK